MRLHGSGTSYHDVSFPSVKSFARRVAKTTGEFPTRVTVICVPPEYVFPPTCILSDTSFSIHWRHRWAFQRVRTSSPDHPERQLRLYSGRKGFVLIFPHRTIVVYCDDIMTGCVEVALDLDPCRS